MMVVYRHFQHTFQYSQLEKVHVPLYDPFKNYIEIRIGIQNITFVYIGINRKESLSCLRVWLGITGSVKIENPCFNQLGHPVLLKSFLSDSKWKISLPLHISFSF